MNDEAFTQAALDLREALDDLWGCIGKVEIEHLQPATIRIAKENHDRLNHLPWFHPHHFADVKSPTPEEEQVSSEPPRLVVLAPESMTFDPNNDAGESTCPLCGKTWLVTVLADCFLPACGCYGSDTSEANPNRPCEPCGLRHAWNCEKLSKESRSDQ